MFTNTFMNVSTHMHQHLISSCMRGEKKWCEMRLTLCEKSGKKGVFILCWMLAVQKVIWACSFSWLSAGAAGIMSLQLTDKKREETDIPGGVKSIIRPWSRTIEIAWGLWGKHQATCALCKEGSFWSCVGSLIPLAASYAPGCRVCMWQC